MNLTGAKSRLMGITKDLTLRWKDTKTIWRDDKCREFERRYLEELLAQVDRTATAIDRLNEVIGKVRSDCE